MNRTILADALHCASEEVVLIPHNRKGRITKADLAEVRLRQQHGRGVLVGTVAGLMATGMSFDDAWQLCLEVCPAIDWTDNQFRCVPNGWPTRKDYEEAKR